MVTRKGRQCRGVEKPGCVGTTLAEEKVEGRRGVEKPGCVRTTLAEEELEGRRLTVRRCGMYHPARVVSCGSSSNSVTVIGEGWSSNPGCVTNLTFRLAR